MRQYTIMMDDRTYNLVNGALAETVQQWQGDGSVSLQDSIARLESVTDALARQRMGTELPAPDDQASEAMEPLPLVAQVMHASHQQDTAVRMALIDSLQRDNDRLMAKYQLITAKINDLCDQDWTPAPRALLAALYPDREAVELRARSIRQGREMH